MVRRLFRWLTLTVLLVGCTGAPTLAAEGQADTYTAAEIADAATGYFGATTKGIADVIERVFADLGEPTAYIAGEEISGAFVVGLRYGKGDLTIKNGGTSRIFWQGPSVGFDIGGNASKTFVLIYGLKDAENIYRRFPGIEGSFYFVAGLGVNYQSDGEITLAPIRTGVGLRQGANIGYLHYNREHSWLPF